MKRFLKSLLVLLLVLVPMTFANAKKKTTTTTTTAATNNTASVINMYVFYGDGCPHCAELEEYVKNNLKLDSRVKDIINVVYFETWYNTTNQQFLSVVGQALGVEIKGVPFIIIGDDYFSGYGSTMNEEIVAKILEKKSDKKYYDLIANLAQQSGITPVTSNPESSSEAEANEKTDSKKNDTVGIIILGVTVVIIIAIIFTRNTSNDDDDEDDDEDDDSEDDSDDSEEDEEDEDDDEESEEVVEEKKTVKKSTASKKKSTKKNKKR